MTVELFVCASTARHFYRVWLFADAFDAATVQQYKRQNLQADGRLQMQER